jgi:hypothetical protein
MAKIRGVDLNIDIVHGELRSDLPDGHVFGFAARIQVGDMIYALEQHYAQQGTAWHAGGLYGGNISIPNHAVPQPANPSAIHGIAQQPRSGVGYAPTVGQIHPPASPASGPQPATCGWCGYTTGHAPTCLFMQRDQSRIRNGHRRAACRPETARRARPSREKRSY